MDWPKAVKMALDRRAESLPEGWTMHTRPEGNLPQELAGMQFDAVATGPNGEGIAFEILFRGSPASRSKASQLRTLRNRVETVPGWKLEVIYYSTSPEELAPRREVNERLESAKTLLENATREDQPVLQAAFMLGFATLEWEIAQWSKKEDLPYAPNARQMAEALVSEGLLPEETFRRIRDFQRVRNSVAHSFSLAPLTPGYVRELLDLVSNLDDVAAQPSHSS